MVNATNSDTSASIQPINTDVMEWKCVVKKSLSCDSCFFYLSTCKAECKTLSSVVGPAVCHTYSYGLRAIIQCLPAWFRFSQCLRRYRDTKRAFPHLVNAGKYSTTFFVVTFAALYATHRGRAHKCLLAKEASHDRGQFV